MPQSNYFIISVGLEISGKYFEYRIVTQITGISVKHKL